MSRFFGKFVLSCAVLLLCVSPSGGATVRESDFLRKLDNARNLYYSGSYVAAEEAFGELSDALQGSNGLKRSEIEAYRVLCRIAMGKVNAEWAVKVFCENYPTAPERAMVLYFLASRYFDNGDYNSAQALFNDINKRYLYKQWRTEFEFKRSFCNMRTGHYGEAREGFSTIIAGKRSIYTYPSIFYLGYVFYILKDFDGAIARFREAAGDSRFEVLSAYYLTECSFMLKDYRYVTENGPGVYEKVDNELKSRLSRILSESFFEMGDRTTAGKYLELYRNSGKDFTRKDFYFSGVMLYDMKDYEGAVESFRKVVPVADSLAQQAWYMMAGCYIRSRNQLAALRAFKAASAMDFDKAVAEDAFFNYAKLSFDVNSDISRFEEYMKAYPKSGRDDEINNYVAASFLLSKDYAMAVDALVKIAKPTEETRTNLRKAAYLRAMQNIADGSYRSALAMLEISRSQGGGNDRLALLTDYWSAECLYREDRYDDALKIYTELIAGSDFARTDEYSVALFNIGYCHFAKGDYHSSLEWFDKYLEAPSDANLEYDARLRLADSHYLLGEYGRAAEIYESAYYSHSDSGDLYPGLQGASSWALASQQGRSIALLKAMRETSRQSQMYPQVLYELGKACNAAGNRQDARECFYTLLGMKSDTTYYAGALASLAAMNVEEGRYEKAIGLYKTLLEDCPTLPEAGEALSSLEEVYRSIERPGEFLEYIDRTGRSDLKDEGEREKMLYLSVERLCASGKFAQATKAAQSFLATYPSGRYSNEVQYLMASSLEAAGRREAALEGYRRLISDSDASIALKAAQSYASLTYRLEQYEKSAKAYGSVIMMSDEPQIRMTALSGRLKASFALKRYDNAISDANTLLTYPEISAQMEREAHYLLAKSYIMKDEREYAKPILARLSSDCSDAYGAEAAYLLIMDSFNSGNFGDVQKRVNAFSDSGTGQLYWLARSYIALGDSFAAQGDAPRAVSIYNSVIERYPEGVDDDIAGRARSRIRKLEVSEKEVAR